MNVEKLVFLFAGQDTTAAERGLVHRVWYCAHMIFPPCVFLRTDVNRGHGPHAASTCVLKDILYLLAGRRSAPVGAHDPSREILRTLLLEGLFFSHVS